MKKKHGITETDEVPAAELMGLSLTHWPTEAPLGLAISRALARKVKPPRRGSGRAIVEEFAGITLGAVHSDPDAGSPEWLHRHAHSVATTLNYAMSAKGVADHGAEWARDQAAESAFALGVIEQHIALKAAVEARALRGDGNIRATTKAHDAARVWNDRKGASAAARDTRVLSLLRSNNIDLLSSRRMERGEMRVAADLVGEALKLQRDQAYSLVQRIRKEAKKKIDP